MQVSLLTASRAHLLLPSAFSPEGVVLGTDGQPVQPLHHRGTESMSVAQSPWGGLPAQGQETVGSLGPGSARGNTGLAANTETLDLHARKPWPVGCLSSEHSDWDPFSCGNEPLQRVDPGQNSLEALPFVGRGDRRSFSLHRDVGTHVTLNKKDHSVSS